MQSTEGRVKAHEKTYVQAGEMQSRLMFHNDAPKTITPVYYGDYEVVRYWQPASESGGDYTEVIDFQYKVEDFLCVGMADSNTDGVSALMLMAQFQSLLHAFVQEGPTPGKLLEDLNYFFCANTAPELEVTAFVCMVNLRDRDLYYANAGHPSPVWFNGDDLIKLPEQGVPLGRSHDSKYDQASVELSPKDRILMYTDGLLNVRSSKKGTLGEERLFEMFRNHRGKTAIPAEQAIADDLAAFGSDSIDDDITMMILDYSV